MEKFLKNIGLDSFDSARSATEALDLYKKYHHDFIFMDCQMPDIDGFEAASMIRNASRNQHKPVIIAVTADAIKGAQEKCLAAGMDDYISKPIDQSRLISVLEKWAFARTTKTEMLAKMNGAVKAQKEPMNAKIFNTSRLDIFTDGNAQAASEIIDVFIHHSSRDIEALKFSFAHQNDDQWHKIVHKLYGSASNIGAENLAQICDEAQQAQTAHMQIYHQRILNAYRNLYHFLKLYGSQERNNRQHFRTS